MHWKNKLKKFHPVLLVLSAIFLICGYGVEILIFFVALAIHELSHAITAKKFGYKLSNFYLMPYGACLSYNSTFLEKEEILIALAGPLSNLVTALVCISFWWIIPASFALTEYFVQCNFYLAIFNFLPCYPLDCGRIIKAILKDKFSENISIKISKILSIMFASIFLIAFIVSVFVKINLNFLMISILLMFGVFDTKFQGKYEKIFCDKQNLLKKGISVKCMAVDSNITLLKLSKKLSSTKYCVFYVTNGERVTMITETTLAKLCQNYSSCCTLQQVINSKRA